MLEFKAVKVLLNTDFCYLTKIKGKDVVKLFDYYFQKETKKDDPFEKYQREIQKSRVNQIEKYLLENEDYILPPVVISIEPEKFEDFSVEEIDDFIVKLSIKENAKITINDGQHRLKAFYNLIGLYQDYVKNPAHLPSGLRGFVKKNYTKLMELSIYEIPVQIFIVFDIERKQQIFSDINRNAKKTAKSLDILFDNRDELANEIKQFLKRHKHLLEIIEVEKSNTKDKAYTIVDIYNIAKELEDYQDFILKVRNKFPFNLPGDKEEYIYPFSVFLMALAKAYKEDKSIIERIELENLVKDSFEGICIFDGKIKKDKKTIERLKEQILNPQLSLLGGW